MNNKNLDTPVIEDLTKLRINKILPGRIRFSYNGVEYMIEDDDSDYKNMMIWLLKRDNNNNIVKDTVLNAKTSKMDINYICKDISKHKITNQNYSNIDREHFVKCLVELGFSRGLFVNEYNKLLYEENRINEEMQKLKEKKKELRANYRKTSNHGSKCYGLKLKREIAERVKPAKVGDYCEEYNDYYGNSDPIYGGVLTDLYSLPCGTQFHVCNGSWDGIIDADEHGDKIVVNCKGIIKLTPTNHSAYIRM